MADEAARLRRLQARAARRILRLLAEQGPLTAKDVSDATRVSRSYAQDLLTVAVHVGMVVAAAQHIPGRRGRPALHYRLAPADPDPAARVL